MLIACPFDLFYFCMSVKYNWLLVSSRLRLSLMECEPGREHNADQYRSDQASFSYRYSDTQSTWSCCVLFCFGLFICAMGLHTYRTLFKGKRFPIPPTFIHITLIYRLGSVFSLENGENVMFIQYCLRFLGHL